MHIPFTKMQGAGNDFVVLDETQGLLNLKPAHYRFLADRHFGVGADQILSVRAASQADVDFDYVIHNADGGQVEHCGNGARCFVQFVRERGLTDKDCIRVKVVNGVLALHQAADGQVTVDMGPPVFELAQIPFDGAGLVDQPVGNWQTWTLDLKPNRHSALLDIAQAATVSIATTVVVLSMGNPHAVLRVDNVDTTPVTTLGPQIQAHPAFTQGVNVGFMQIKSRSQVALRVYERGAGETLACGTGACAAVVAGIRLGWLDDAVQVHTRGGILGVQWSGYMPPHADPPVFMTGPATTVFQGTINISDSL